MGFQEELDALAARYQGQPFDPFENTQSAQVNQPMPMSQAPQDDLISQIMSIFSPELSSEGQGRYQESLARPYGQTFQEEGGLGVFNQFMDNNPLPTPMDALKGLGTLIGGQSLMGQQAPTQPQSTPSSTTRLPIEQSLREADPIAQIQQALYSPTGGDLGGEGRGFSKGAAGSSDIAADRYRNVIRDAAMQNAGQGAPLTDKERIGRKMEDMIIGGGKNPGLIGSVAGQDPEIMTQLVNSVREITGLGPKEAQELVDQSDGMSGGEMLGMLVAGGATILGGKKLAKGLASRKAGKFKSVPGGKAPKAKGEMGAFKTGSANKAGGYQGTREVGFPEKGFQMKEGSSSKAPSGAEIRAAKRKASSVPTEAPKRLEYLMEKKKLTPEELADLKDMFKGVFKQKK